MEINKVVVGDYKTNCYIISIGNYALVIDPGAEYLKIEKEIKDKKVLGAIITHSHFDHIMEKDKFKKVYSFEILKEGYTKIGPFEFETIYTSGHSDDSITLYFPNEKIMFTGDFLFYNTVGRTDLPGGNTIKMRKSIDKIRKYSDCTIYPGHGWDTTLKNEKENNPYFRGDLYEG